MMGGVLAIETTLDPVQLLLTQAGVAGAVVVLMIFGVLWAKPAVAREFQKADDRDRQQQALIDTMLAVYHSEVLPTLADVDKRLIPLLESVHRLLGRMEVLFERAEDVVAARQYRDLDAARRPERDRASD